MPFAMSSRKRPRPRRNRSSPARRGEARALLALGRSAEARVLAEELVASDSADVDLMLLVAQARTATGDPGAALELLGQARTRAPERADVRKLLGDVALGVDLELRAHFVGAHHDQLRRRPLGRLSLAAIGAEDVVHRQFPAAVDAELHRRKADLGHLCVAILRQIEHELLADVAGLHIDQAQALRAALASNESFAKYGLDRPAYLSDFTFRVAKGRKLYADICAECHLGPVADTVFDKTYPDKSFFILGVSNVSYGLTPAARTRTSTSPGPGFGVGTSWSARTSGPPTRHGGNSDPGCSAARSIFPACAAEQSTPTSRWR